MADGGDRAPRGAPLLNLVELRLNEGYKFSHIAGELGLARNSLTRMLADAGWQGVYHHVPLQQLKEIIVEVIPLRRAGSNWGVRSVQAMLRIRKMRVPRRDIREALSQLQPLHMERRRVGRLFRGQYTVTKPMVLWHMDSYDKLSPWKIRIHGCIDGGSHYVLWAKVASNKRKETIFEAYSGATRKFGHPLRIRSDYAGEHVLVQQDITAARPGVHRAYLTGSSVHNQRIEKFWRQVWTHTAFFFKHLLAVMEENGTLLIKNPWHVSSLHAVFIPAIQMDLDNMIAMWNVHRVRQINENGRFLPSHIPAVVFKPLDREMRLIPPPVDAEAPTLRRLEDYDLAQAMRPDVESEQDPATPLAEAILHLRDTAYDAGVTAVRDLAEAFLLHLSLTLECAAAARSEEGFLQHLHTTAAATNVERAHAAQLLLGVAGAGDAANPIN